MMPNAEARDLHQPDENTLQLERETRRQLRRLVEYAGDFRRIPTLNREAVSTAAGVPEALVASVQESLIMLERLFACHNSLPAISTPAGVHEVFRFLSLPQHEELWVGLVSNTGRMTQRLQVGHGGRMTLRVTPGELLSKVLRRDGRRIVLVHNHPSGDPRPSDDDIRYTRRIARAARLLEVELLDHVIISLDQYFSFREHLLL